MLGSNCSCWSIQASVDYASLEDAWTHVWSLGTAVYNMVDRLQGKVPCHKLYNWLQAHKWSSNCEPCKPCLRNWRIFYSLLSVLIRKPLRYFICPLVFSNLLPNDENLRIPRHLLIQSRVQRFSNRDFLGEVPCNLLCYYFQHLDKDFDIQNYIILSSYLF